MISFTIEECVQSLHPWPNPAFGCVRPLVFEKSNGFPSINGTGFLIKLFDQVFFVTSRHAMKHYDIHHDFPLIRYNLIDNSLIQIDELIYYMPEIEGDEDHADIVLYRLKMSVFDTDKLKGYHPFDIGPDNVLDQYHSSSLLNFVGCASELSDLDYKEKIYNLTFAGGQLIYDCETSCLEIHRGTAKIDDFFPDFDGISGSPLFKLPDEATRNRKVLFAGMLIQASRQTKIMRFLSSGRIARYILNSCVPNRRGHDANDRMIQLFKNHYKIG
jgi:hypothetical protein